MNVLVTGGAGYIGSHVARALTVAGFTPIIVDNLSRNTDRGIEGREFMKADLTDTETIVTLFRETEIGAVIHMAAFIEVGESVKEPLTYYENNIGGTISLLDAMTECGVNHLIFSSTAAVYGEPEVIPIPENHPTRATSPYGKSKLMAEQIIADTESATDLKTVRLRYFNACGAHRDGGIGENHDPETHLIPRACLAILGKVPPLEIFGTDYPTPDGTAIRDYVHVEDIAQAHVQALQYLIDGGAGTAFNLGSGNGYSVHEIIEAVENVSGQTVPRTFAPRREGDPARLVADSTSAREVLNWQPVYTSIEVIAATAWKWHSTEQ
ncbi:UDP-glucose 4-epimerase GalE [soil metagenome]